MRLSALLTQKLTQIPAFVNYVKSRVNYRFKRVFPVSENYTQHIPPNADPDACDGSAVHRLHSFRVLFADENGTGLGLADALSKTNRIYHA